MTQLTQEQFIAIMQKLSDEVKTCPQCGKPRYVSAVFEDNDHDEIIGFRVICPCCDDPSDFGNLPILTTEELDKELR